MKPTAVWISKHLCDTFPIENDCFSALLLYMKLGRFT